jgi:hypothetical protein
MEDYESGQLEGGQHIHTIRSFLDGQAHVGGGISITALRVKASVLYERADRLATYWDPRLSSNAFREEILTLEHTISRFMTTLIPLHQLDATLPETKHASVVIHSLANAAMIHLYFRFSQDDSIAYDKALRAARACVNVINYIADNDFDFLDPIIGPCWTCAAQVLIQELGNMETSWPLFDSRDIRSELSTVLYAMNALGTRFPLLGFSAAKLQKRLAEL